MVDVANLGSVGNSAFCRYIEDAVKGSCSPEPSIRYTSRVYNVCKTCKELDTDDVVHCTNCDTWHCDRCIQGHNCLNIA